MNAPQPTMQNVLLGEMRTTARIVAAEGGVIIDKGPNLFVPDADLQKLDQIGKELDEEVAAAKAQGKVACEHCAEWFAPRRSGGRRQRFCSEGCRRAFHAENPNAGQRQQRETPIQSNAGHVETNIGRAPEDFDWEAHTVAPTQAAIAVYENQAGAVVIRQEGQYGPDEDVWIVIQRQNLAAVIAALEQKRREYEQESPSA